MMFDSLLGFTADEETIFYKISAEVVNNFSAMSGEFVFFRLKKRGEAQSTVCEIHRFDNYGDYADFLYAHKYSPHYVMFANNKKYAKMAMDGFYKFIAHDIHNSLFKRTYSRDRNPNRPATLMIPRDLAENGLAELAAAVSLVKASRAV